MPVGFFCKDTAFSTYQFAKKLYFCNLYAIHFKV